MFKTECVPLENSHQPSIELVFFSNKLFPLLACHDQATCWLFGWLLVHPKQNWIYNREPARFRGLMAQKRKIYRALRSPFFGRHNKLLNLCQKFPRRPCFADHPSRATRTPPPSISGGRNIFSEISLCTAINNLQNPAPQIYSHLMISNLARVAFTVNLFIWFA